MRRTWVCVGVLGVILAGCLTDDGGVAGADVDGAGVDAGAADTADSAVGGDAGAADTATDSGAADTAGDASDQDALGDVGSGDASDQDALGDVASGDATADAANDTGSVDTWEDVGAADAADAAPSDVGYDGGPDGVTVACFGAGDPVFPAFDKTCVSDSGCTVATHQVNCCGTLVALGIAVGAVPDFEVAEALCQSQYPGCGCASEQTTDEQGQPGIAFMATCDNGACTSHAASVPPMGENDLQPWLDAQSYGTWEGESAPHSSAGPHFGKVRVYVNGPLAASMAAGEQTHPVGAAAVKELYGEGDTVLGWSVLLRASSGSEGQGWYWYERWQDTVFADGLAASQCTGCHGAGTDYVLTSWPLQ